MLARLERDLGLGLAGAEMQMVKVARDRLVERRQVGVDQQVVMAGVFAVGTGGRYAHVAQAEIERGLGRDGGAVLEIDEIDFGARPRRRRAAGLLTVGQHDAARHCGDRQQKRTGAREPAILPAARCC